MAPLQGGPPFFQLPAKLALAAAAGQQAFAQLQQAAPQRFGLIPLLTAAETQLARANLEAAAGHGAALFEQLPLQGHGPAASQFAACLLQVGEHQGVAEDVAENLVVDGLVTHQVHRPPDQAAAEGTRGAARRRTALQGRATATTTTTADAIEGQKGEAAGPAAFEQVDGPGGDGVVLHHHLGQAGPGGHLQGDAVPFLHLPQLGHWPVDSLQPRFQQQPQGPGAPAFLQGFAAAIQPSDLPLQFCLLLLQPLAGALLQGKGFHQLLQGGLLPFQFLLQGQGFACLDRQPGFQLLVATALGPPLGLQLRQPFGSLTAALLPLLPFRLQGGEAFPQAAALLAAVPLLVHPAAGAAGHFPQPPP